MAISVDTIYQRVLALANKEQRGYVTPQEFNLLANQAQMTIFESYFYSKNKIDRLESERVDDSESSISELLDTKLRPFTAISSMTSGGSGYWSYPTTAYQIGLVYDNAGMACHKLSTTEFVRIQNDVRRAGIEAVYCDSSSTSGDIRVLKEGAFLAGAGQVTCDAITKPIAVAWGYVVINNKALYNANTSVNFQLHDSEEDTLVNLILESAGVILNKPGLVQVASTRNTNEQTIQNA